jgi:putative DNA methylase
VEIRRSCGGVLPPVYDPFSGGGSIPLEAQRLGLAAYGSDLNPVAVMIGKAMIEIPPTFRGMAAMHPGVKERSFYRNAEGLAEDVKYYGEWMREKAWERIGHLYPQVDLPKNYGGGKGTVVAWIWARTVPSPDPAFADVQVPLISSYTLRNSEGQEVWIKPFVEKANKTYHFEIQSSPECQFDEVFNEGTKTGSATFRCILTDAPILAKYIDDMASKGKMERRLIAAVAETKSGKAYVAGEYIDLLSLEHNVQHLLSNPEVHDKLPMQKCRGTFASNAQGRHYGFNVFADYFIPRQQVAMATFVSCITELHERIKLDLSAPQHNDHGVPPDLVDLYAAAVCLYLSFAIDRVADAGSSMATWAADGFIRFTFARQGIAMTWDFVEANPFSDSTGNLLGAVTWVVKAIENFVPANKGHVIQASAEAAPIPSNAVISTDPPYYSNISYADLSDYFYVWMKQSVGYLFPEQFGTLLVPKAEELIADRYRQGSDESARAFFLTGMTRALSAIHEKEPNESPAAIYYAFKKSEIGKEGMTSSGWITFLRAVLEAQYQIVRTWPVRTERSARTVAIGNNALASSIVLICRKRVGNAKACTRAEFIRALKRELPASIRELQEANISPADMPQCAIGPGIGVFSRYRAVLESNDDPMSVDVALQLINRELDEYLGGIQGEFDADTRFAITWFEQNGLKAGDYGTANKIATARGISVESVKHAGIVESGAGKVRILARDELADDWEPDEDRHLTVWECLQHLVRQYEKDGISHGTAVLLKKINVKAEAVKDLAYCLYDISANKRKDAKEAKAYNALIADWTELTRQAATIHDTSGDRQIRFDI